MKAVVVRDFGVIVGAYWTPDITLDASNGAEWFLSVNGRALGIEYRSEERYCTYLRKMIPGAPVRSGTDADELARGANMPAEIRQARESAEQVQPDGSVRKVNIFRHAGFVAV